MGKKTQAERVLEYIKKFGSITTLDAFKDLGVTRLSARIFELRNQGYNLETNYESRKNRFGETCIYARYTLKGD
ncbi:MAG: helix-turn-helix domain-containing protein [Firmicutes bacterium]|nr:helix-turn-helix domain-containing protein [Candidatus Alectryobacillus merdavium]